MPHRYMTKSAEIESSIRRYLSEHEDVRQKDILQGFSGSRPLVAFVFNKLVRSGTLLRAGATANVRYLLNTKKNLNLLVEEIKTVRKTFVNKDLSDDKVYEQVRSEMPAIQTLTENVQSILYYAFTEMMNNAIDHSESEKITVKLAIDDERVAFDIIDKGVGVFKNVMKKQKLPSEIDAIAELQKGKVTTAPKMHSGEGIFFTSKAADVFELRSSSYVYRVDNLEKDIFVGEIPRVDGTVVHFEIATDSKRHLISVFEPYQTNPEEPAFDKTDIKVRLFTHGSIHISRSQAKRIMVGLEKFNTVVLDYDQIPLIGQAFADQIYRVFAKEHPKIKIITKNANEAVQFMINRVSK